MTEISNSSMGTKISKSSEVILGAVGAVVCSIVAVLTAISQGSAPGDLLPFPGLYLLEIAIIGIFGFFSVLQWDTMPIWRVVPWVGSGILLAFVILGAWTIGLYLIPAMIAFFLAAMIGDLRSRQRLSKGILWFFGAGLLQALFILIMVVVDIS